MIEENWRKDRENAKNSANSTSLCTVNELGSAKICTRPAYSILFKTGLAASVKYCPSVMKKLFVARKFGDSTLFCHLVKFVRNKV